MRRIMLLVVVALVMAAMLAMGAGPVLADGNPRCGLSGQGEWASDAEPGYVGEAVSGSALSAHEVGPPGAFGQGNATGANQCAGDHPAEPSL